MTYKLAEGFGPGYYTLGEGHMLEATDNELTPAQAAEFVEHGILVDAEPSSAPEPEPEEETEEGEE